MTIEEERAEFEQQMKLLPEVLATMPGPQQATLLADAQARREALYMPTTATGNYTLKRTDTTLFLDAKDNDIILTIPKPTTDWIGKRFDIKRIDDSGHIISFITTDSTLDGNPSMMFDTGFRIASLETNGANWFLMGNN